jgi:hypothetical protein
MYKLVYYVLLDLLVHIGNYSSKRNQYQFLSIYENIQFELLNKYNQ